MRMTDVTWHRRDPTGMVTEIVRRRRHYANPGWRLTRPTTFDVQSARRTQANGDAVFATGVTPTQIEIRKADADAESLPTCPARSRRSAPPGIAPASWKAAGGTRFPARCRPC
jgi:hypothetical protein